MLLAFGVFGGSPAPNSLANTRAGTEASVLLNGVPEQGNSLGQRHARVTLVIFGDLQSPITGKFLDGVFPNLVKRWVRAGSLRVTYRSFESVTPAPSEFERQQVAALAAGDQNRAWPFIEVFSREQVLEETETVPAPRFEYVFGYATERFLEEIAMQTEGLNLSQWRADRLKPAHRRQIAEDKRVADRRHLAATPSFLIGHAGSSLHLLEPEEGRQLQTFNKAIRALLRR
jgi:hypothetical protein